MKNKKILAAILAATIATAWISYSFADDTQTGSKLSFKKFGFEKTQLTDEQKAEKLAKMEEMKLQRESREAVIDDLLAWNTLTSQQEVLRAQIITERNERKTKMLEQNEQREIMKAIFDKKKAWEELTSDEQEQLDSLKGSFKWNEGNKFDKINGMMRHR
jgi:hypothetical protein